MSDAKWAALGVIAVVILIFILIRLDMRIEANEELLEILGEKLQAVINGRDRTD